jgi:hypothetical protein
MRSMIGKQKKRALASRPIYVPSQWISVISAAKKTRTPYRITEMDFSDFIDIKEMKTQTGSNFNKTTENKKILWNDIHAIKVTKDTHN